MNQKIKIWFCNFWSGFNKKDNYLTQMIRDIDYEVSPDNPNIVFAARFGKSHEYEKFSTSIKVQVIHSEKHFSFQPAEFDYCIGDVDQTLKDTDRSVYLPFWLARNFQSGGDMDQIWNKAQIDDFLLNRKFCNFIGKIEGRPYRKQFIEALSKYKNVDAIMDGAYQCNKLPNDNGFQSKIDWTRNFKYSICFENEAKKGYLTEKIADSIFAKSMPIYFGDKETVLKDFDLDEDLIIENEQSFEKAISKIKWYEENPHEYLKQMKKPIVRENAIENYVKSFNQFLTRILEYKKPLTVSKSTRTISVKDLMEHSFVISTDLDRLEFFYKVFKANKLLPLPRKFNGIQFNRIESWRCGGLQKTNQKVLPPIGCITSHIALISAAKIMDWPFICIFEEDAYPCNGILERLEYYLSDIPSEINLLTLGNINFHSNGKNISSRHIGFDLNYGSHAYILFRSGYDEYVEALKHGNCVADVIFTSIPKHYSTAENMFAQFNMTHSTISNQIGLINRNFPQETIKKWFPDPTKYMKKTI